MRKLLNIVLLLFVVLLLSSCGDEVSYTNRISYAGEVNDNYYFYSTYFQTRNERRIFQLEDDGRFNEVYSFKDKDFIAILSDDSFLFSKPQSGDSCLYRYSLVNIDTLEETTLNFGENNEICFEFISYGEDHILLQGEGSEGSIHFIIYDLVKEEVTHNYETYQIIAGYQNIRGFYDGDYIYIHFNYTTYYLGNKDIIIDTELNRVNYYNSTTYEDLFITYKDVYVFYSNEMLKSKQSIDLDNFTVNYDRHDKKVYDEKIYINLSSYGKINVYSSDFELVDNYSYEDICRYGEIINGEEVMCIYKKDVGSIFSKTYKKIVIYNFAIDEITYETYWFKASSQVEYLDATIGCK